VENAAGEKGKIQTHISRRREIVWRKRSAKQGPTYPMFRGIIELGNERVKNQDDPWAPRTTMGGGDAEATAARGAKRIWHSIDTIRECGIGEKTKPSREKLACQMQNKEDKEGSKKKEKASAHRGVVQRKKKNYIPLEGRGGGENRELLPLRDGGGEGRKKKGEVKKTETNERRQGRGAKNSRHLGARVF